MTQDEIIEMARQAGFPFNKYGLLQGDDEGEIDADTMFEAFAKLVAAKEREICAHICEILWAYPDNGMATEEEVYGAKCADAIRSRGKE